MKNWIHSSVIYQVNLRSLAAREPRNAIEAAKEKPLDESPLAYLARHLGAVKKLGANVVYLMPPYPVGLEERKGIGSPYAIRDFKAVDPEFGTIEELADLVRRAHRAGLKVILDLTPNHTSRDHVWIGAHPEYYVHDDQGRIFHDCDWSDTAKLDYRCPDLRREMTGVYDFWLGLLGPDANGQPDGVDGFRLDMAHFINDLTFWNEALPQLKSRHAARQILFLAECYGTRNNLDLFARGINAAYDDDFYKVCVFLYGVGPDGRSIIALSPDAEGNADFRDKLAAFRSDGIAGAMEKALANYESVLLPGEESPRLARYVDNHDEGRGVYRYGEGAARAVMQLAFLSGHCLPFLLTGQEFGALNRPPIHDRIGLCDKSRRIVRADRTDWRAGVEFEGNLFARGAADRAAWYGFYRTLIRLRRATRELQLGDFELLDAGEVAERPQRTVIAFDRRLRGRTVRCAVNLGPEDRRLRRADLFAGHALYGALADGMLPAFSATAVRVAG
jgi:glycosidase